jgi:hypothetical protein
MKIKCGICGKVETTYCYSPNHILKLCDEHWKWFKDKKAKGLDKDLPLWLL